MSFLRTQESSEARERSNLDFMDQYFIYILASQRNGTLYIGVTNDLSRRIAEHKHDVIEGFTKKYQVHSLVYFEVFNDTENAIKREKQLKRWKRLWKLKLIDQVNPEWKGLYYDLSSSGSLRPQG